MSDRRVWQPGDLQQEGSTMATTKKATRKTTNKTPAKTGEEGTGRQPGKSAPATR